MPSELLDRADGSVSHREMATERMTQAVRTAMGKSCPSFRPLDKQTAHFGMLILAEMCFSDPNQELGSLRQYLFDDLSLWKSLGRLLQDLGKVFEGECEVFVPGFACFVGPTGLELEQPALVQQIRIEGSQSTYPR